MDHQVNVADTYGGFEGTAKTILKTPGICWREFPLFKLNVKYNYHTKHWQNALKLPRSSTYQQQRLNFAKSLNNGHNFGAGREYWSSPTD